MTQKVTLSFKGDKSISHRSAIFAALNSELSKFENYSMGEDCHSTLEILKTLGATIINDNSLFIQVCGPLSADNGDPNDLILDAGNSGTTARLMTGFLSGLNIPCKITGDASLMKRPMERIAAPLKMMGADIELTEAGTGPIIINKNNGLKGLNYELPVASAQIKSSILLAGLFANGDTVVTDPFYTRDHTERMLDLKIEDTAITSNTHAAFQPGNYFIPGDISSASFFIVLALIGNDICFKAENVSLNPGRLAFVNFLQKMGANIEIEATGISMNEPFGNIYAQSSIIEGGVLEAKDTPGVIDEIPLLSVLALHSKQGILFENAGELRFKESDRIHSIMSNLKRMGASCLENGDQFIIYPLEKNKFNPVSIESFADHRIAMAMAIAARSYGQPVEVDNKNCVEISYPGFFDDLNKFNG